jgi:hypothetical protein
MKRLLILAPLFLAACAEFPMGAALGLLPTPEQICAMSPGTQAALAAQLQTDLANLTAACEIVKG